MNEQQNTAVVKQAYAAFQKGDIPSVLGSLDENVDWQPVIGANPKVPVAGRRRGRAETGKFFEAISKNVAFSVFDPREYVAQGDQVVALGHYTSKVIPTGLTFDSDFAMVFTVKNGKVTKFSEYCDSAALNRAFAATN